MASMTNGPSRPGPSSPPGANVDVGAERPRQHVEHGRQPLAQVHDRRLAAALAGECQQLARQALATAGGPLDGFEQLPLVQRAAPQELDAAADHQEQIVEIVRSEEHTSELQSPDHLVCRLLLEKKKK